MKSEKEKYLTIFENCDSFVDLGRHVAYYRKQAGLTQLKLSRKLKVSRGYLGRIEAPGLNQHFSFELFFNICRTLDVAPEYFFMPLPGSGSK